jgi:ABC-type multidrug transport system ATPase subunit
VIAHRLSTIRKADRIIVLHNGRTIEEGSHEQLMSTDDGMYFNLVNAQQLEAASAKRAEIDEVDLPEGERLDRKITWHDEEIDKEKLDTRKKRSDYLVLVRILYEQRARWVFCVPLVIAALGCGGKI